MRSAFALALVISGAALADPATDARLFFRRGTELAGAGRSADALDAFLASQAAANNPNTLLAVAQLYEALGHADPAYVAYAELEAAVDGPLRGQATKALSRLSRRVAPVAVRTEPPGADVYLERESAGRACRTPCRIAVAPGHHRLRVRLDGWRPADVDVQARRGREARLDVSLARITGTLRVETNAAAATVRAIGPVEAEAPTPADLTLPPGRYDVEIGGAAWTPVRREAVVWADKVTRLSVSLAPSAAPRARLLLAYTGPGARVSIDGEDAGFAPLMLDVPPGLRRIRIEQDVGRPWEERVAFESGEHVRIFAAPPPGDEGRTKWAPLFALGVGVAAAGAGSWLVWEEDFPVLGTATLAAAGAAFTVAVGLLLDDRMPPAVATRIEREAATAAAP